MKKTLFFFLTVALVTLSTAAIIDFQGAGGSARSRCSSLFVTCEAICQETHIYSTANCDQISYFPDCHCNGLLKKESKMITADPGQLKNMDRFISFISERPIDRQAELTSALKKIKTAIEQESYTAYKSGITGYLKISQDLPASDENLLDDWVKENTSHTR